MSVWDDLIKLRFEWIYNLYSESFEVEGWTLEECHKEAEEEMKRRQWQDGFVFVNGYNIESPILLGKPSYYSFN